MLGLHLSLYVHMYVNFSYPLHHFTSLYYAWSTNKLKVTADLVEIEQYLRCGSCLHHQGDE
jgi:hypothetical protein